MLAHVLRRVCDRADAAVRALRRVPSHDRVLPDRDKVPAPSSLPTIRVLGHEARRTVRPSWP